jgi:lysophospholipase L1-like esterase
LIKIFTFRLFLIVPTLLVLVVLEFAYRGYLYYQDKIIEQQVEQLSKVQKRDPEEPLRLKHIIKWNDNPLILYDLIPSIKGIFMGEKMSINEFGFRQQPVYIGGSDDVLRVAGIGDSVMFGWGVSDEETYLALLAPYLIENGCKSGVDVVNSAVPGYNAVMAVETLNAKLLQFHPDVVIYHYVLNDLNLPSFIKKKNPVFTQKSSLLARMIKQRLRNQFASDYRLVYPPEEVTDRDFIGEEDEIPDEYRSLVGLPAFEEAMQKFLELAKTNNFFPIVITHYLVPKEITERLDKLGLTILNSYSLAQNYLKISGEKQFPGSTLTVSETDRHPSAEYHQIIAKFLASEIPKLSVCN